LYYFDTISGAPLVNFNFLNSDRNFFKTLFYMAACLNENLQTVVSFLAFRKDLLAFRILTTNT
jgi:hypothetical protein